MIEKAYFSSLSIDELWELHEEISKLLKSKMLAEKKRLEERLSKLRSLPSKDPSP